MMDDIAARSHPIRFLDVVGCDRENWSTIDGPGGDDTFFASLAAGRFRRIGHADNIKHGVGLPAFGF